MYHIHVINQVIEKSAEYNQPLYLAFIDSEKAFDSLEIPAVIEAARSQGAPEAYVNMLVNIYKGSTAILVLREKSRELPIKKGIRQEGTISSMLFNTCLEELLKPLDKEGVSATFGLQMTLSCSGTAGTNYNKCLKTLTEEVSGWG